MCVCVCVLWALCVVWPNHNAAGNHSNLRREGGANEYVCVCVLHVLSGLPILLSFHLQSASQSA